jgi:hypothetical protein
MGPWVRINEYTVNGSSIYEDAGLPPLERFYYQIVARDASYNEGTFSTIVSGTTNPPMKAGWPQEIEQQSSSSVVFADLDADWRMELLTGSDMQYAWHCDGSEVVDGDQNRRTNGPFSLYGKRTGETGFSATPAVGDIDQDGDMEVVNVGIFSDSLFVWDHQGQLLWAKSLLDSWNWASPVIADLDVDGDLEILAWAGSGGRLFGWHHDGTEIIDGDSNPATDGVIKRIFGVSFNYGSPAVGNLDGDLDLEIVFPINLSSDDSGGVYAIDWNGTDLPGWPVFTGEAAHPSEVPSSPVIVDLDRNGDMEVIVACERSGGAIFVYHHDGTPDPNFPVFVAAKSVSMRIPSPSLGDLNGDSFLDIVYPSTDGELLAYDRFGNVLPGFPVEFASMSTQATECTPTLVDVDGDNQLEIIFGDESSKLHGFNHNGSELAGFPIQLGGEVRGTAAIWDCDGDNLVEIAVNCYDANVYVWDLEYHFNPTLAPWPLFRHDTRNTGNFGQDVLPVGIADPGAEGAPVLPARPALHPAVPNPFNPRTTIGFDVPGEAGSARRVELAIYDVSGRLVETVASSTLAAGRHRFPTPSLASGVYSCRLITDGGGQAVRRFVVLR